MIILLPTVSLAFNWAMAHWNTQCIELWDDYRRFGPLWVQVDAMLGTESDKAGRQKAASNWLRLYTLLSDPDNRDEFEARLSGPQKTSWRILTEWWDADYQSRELVEPVQRLIQDIATTGTSEYDASPGPAPGSERSFYHSLLSDLWRNEFFPNDTVFKDVDGEIVVDTDSLAQVYDDLDDIRREALEHSTFQRMAYRHLIQPRPQNRRENEHHGVTLEPCSWLDMNPEQEGWPYFLWDIHGRKTVKSHELSALPRYTCISHTWGRWRTSVSKDVQGVPWLVPENTRFSVEALSESFATAHWTTSYLWFDLFCIPQDGSILANNEISRQSAIFRNASASVIWLNDVDSWEILPNAISWWSLTYLRATSERGLYDVDQRLAQLYKASDFPIELGTEQSFSPFATNRAVSWLQKAGQWRFPSSNPLNGWFSSLWTLQEAFLRPGALLCSRNWEPLKDKAGYIVTLDTLLTLYSTASGFVRFAQGAQHDFRDWKAYTINSGLKIGATMYQPEYRLQIPQGARQLAQMSLRTKLYTLGEPSEVAVLMLGNLRQCTESRAQAIMSAVGATDWFVEYVKVHGTSPPENNLVMGTYPLPFVEEASKKMGAIFYSTLREPPGLLSLLFIAWCRQYLGSMLPFTIPFFQPSMRTFLSSRIGNVDFPEIQTWTITETGSVKISYAAVVGAEPRLGRRDANFRAVIIDYHKGKDRYREVNLQAWMREQSRLYSWYAIALTRRRAQITGLVLKSVPLCGYKTTYLVKVAAFKTSDYYGPIPKVNSETVNWVVL